jgi:hypothetical protein
MRHVGENTPVNWVNPCDIIPGGFAKPMFNCIQSFIVRVFGLGTLDIQGHVFNFLSSDATLAMHIANNVYRAKLQIQLDALVC